MAQSLWHCKDIARIGQTLVDVAPCPEFAAGVAALCQAVGAQVSLPDLHVQVTVEKERRALGLEVRR